MPANFTTTLMMLGDMTKEQLSDPVRGAGYYGYMDGHHTISVTFNQFVGRILIEGTLALEPQDNDWFPIWLTGTTPYKEYLIPSKNGSEAFAFQGNFVLLRFRKSQSYLNSSFTRVGDITKVMLSL
jgi:hypothetical protein